MNSVSFSKESSFNIFYYFKYLFSRRHEDMRYLKRLNELESIIKNGEISTFFQPIVNLQSGETFGFEALNRPMKSNLFPTTDNFYDFVGKTDRVFEFERFCRNISIRRYMNQIEEKKLTEQYVLFLNVHPQVLLDKNYQSGATLQLLTDMGIHPEQVVFELTERSALTDFQEFVKVLSHYRSQGYRIAIDDVGSGYNSLKTLVYLQPEFVKLDRSLIQNIDKNIVSQQLVSLIADYAEKSGTKIIAEGIERFEDLTYIQSAGIHLAQGYAIGKPEKELHLGKIPSVFNKY